MTQLGRADLDERFEVVGTLGRGSYGVVHHVRDRRTGAAFALKLLTGQGERGRTERELEVSLQLDHPHVVRCFAGALTEDGGYLLLELCQGSLADVLVDRERRADAWELLAQTAEGLAALHARGLVHRDLKPSNVLLSEGRAKVADLGLVRGADLHTMTAEGMVLGTPAFMAPEQARGDRVGPAADVFALGVMLFDVVEGHLPYPDEPPMKLLARVARGDLYPLRRALEELPEPARDLLAAMLSPDPGRRPTDLAAAAAVLRAHPPGHLEDPGATSISTAPLDRSRAMARTAPRGLRPPPRRSFAPQALGAVALALLVGLLWPAGPAEKATPALDTGPFPADYLRRLDDELQWASRQVVRVDGGLRDGAEGPPGEGERDLLTWDPLGAFGAMQHLPEVQRFYAWVRSGGQVEALSPALRAGLGEVGDAYARRRFRPVFSPLLDVAPEPGSGPVPGYPDMPPEYGLGVEPTDPWQRAATEHAKRYLRLHHEYEKALYAVVAHEPTDVPELVVRQLQAPFAMVTSVLDRRALAPLLVPAWVDPANRPRLGTWMAPLNDELERFFAAAARAAGTPGSREWLTRLFSGSLPVHDLGDLGPMAMAPPEVLLGALPTNTEGRFLLAHLLRHQVHGRVLLGYPAEEARTRRVELLEGLLAEVDPVHHNGYSRHVLRMALHEHQMRNDRAGFRRVFVAHMPALVRSRPMPVHDVGSYLRSARRLVDPLPFTKAELEALRAPMMEGLQGLPPRPEDDKLEAPLDQMVARAPDALPAELATP